MSANAEHGADEALTEFCRDLEASLEVRPLLKVAEGTPEAAAELLRVAARLLRERRALPGELADYLADAFESAMAKPKESRLKELGRELKLTALNRRQKKFDPWAVDLALLMAHEAGARSETKAIAHVARKFGVSPATIRRFLRKGERTFSGAMSQRVRELEDRIQELAFEGEAAEIMRGIIGNLKSGRFPNHHLAKGVGKRAIAMRKRGRR